MDKVKEFYLAYRPFAKERIDDILKKHMEYRTIVILEDEKGISGLLRFNVYGECAHIIDLIVREDVERNGLIKLLTIYAWRNFPYLRFFRFERAGKYPNRTPRAYLISNLLKGR